MKQTDKYKFNIIETGDAFSPDPLNANARAVETQLAALDAAKVEKTALSAETAARQAALNAETAARQAALNAEQTALNALAGRVGTLEAGRLLWTTGSYVGTGDHNSGNPRRIEFPFKPLMVIVNDSSSWQFGGFPWLNGASMGRQFLGTSGGSYIVLRWSGRTVQFYSNVNSMDAEWHLDALNHTYRYFALGVNE